MSRMIFSTHADVNHPSSSGDFELMISLQRYGGIWPITESSTGSPVERVTIAGYTWELFTGWNGAMRVCSFLPPSGTSHNSFSADVKELWHRGLHRWSCAF
ncbi:uncharacterized protein PpBr36_10786 [Pyricularia pennisetigena]|uniref:uncharacterized protein n=1 Tax=Pyricularia pennisetigena TaxID=1578925 RepID=UPI00114E4E90|nr:uncharacterized protein PpBr36_10786 [Pyricularia pennisetigena]TLS20991.1 hypothetical protein PpBr36_10786 [Pyricularia pennisetigena]